MTTAESAHGHPAATGRAVLTQGLDGIVGARRPVAAMRGHDRADRELIAPDQAAQGTGHGCRENRRSGQRPGARPLDRIGRSCPVTGTTDNTRASSNTGTRGSTDTGRGRSNGTGGVILPRFGLLGVGPHDGSPADACVEGPLERPRGRRAEGLAEGLTWPAQMASRSARNSRLKSAGAASGGRDGEAGADAGARGARIRRTRMPGDRSRDRSAAVASRQDSRATRLTVLRRTAERSSRFGTLMTNRGSSLRPGVGSARGAV